MKYLNRFNENIDNECDFDTFRDILYTLSDNYSDVDFIEDEESFVCAIDIGDSFQIDSMFISTIRYGYNNKMPNNFHLLDFNEEMSNHTNKLNELKIELDSIIRKNNEIGKIVDVVNKKILPIFEKFSNFGSIDIVCDDYIEIVFLKIGKI